MKSFIYSLQCLLVNSLPIARHRISFQFRRSMHMADRIESFGQTAENSIFSWLVEDKSKIDSSISREVRGSHYVKVKPETVPEFSLVIGSRSCAESIGLEPTEIDSLKFAEAFCGNKLLPGLDTPSATIYGCHSFGTWFGQLGNVLEYCPLVSSKINLGDGRAVSLGEVYDPVLAST